MAEVGELYGCNARSGVLLLFLPFFVVQLSAAIQVQMIGDGLANHCVLAY
jgi:hypothetical protein